MYYLTHADWEALDRAWVEGTEAELGSAFGDLRDSPKEAVLREGYEVLGVHAGGAVLAHSKHKHYYYVRLDNGPWGVDVTTVARAIFGDKLSIHA
jgi:hypothetical protein